MPQRIPPWFDGALQANPELGLPIAAGDTPVVVELTAAATFGALTTTAEVTSAPPAPPDVTPYITVGGFITNPTLKPRPLKPPVHTVEGAAHANLGPLTAHAVVSVTFSVLADEDELLLVLT